MGLIKKKIALLYVLVNLIFKICAVLRCKLWGQFVLPLINPCRFVFFILVCLFSFFALMLPRPIQINMRHIPLVPQPVPSCL